MICKFDFIEVMILVLDVGFGRRVWFRVGVMMIRD
jgi:hypothetical protein